MVEYAKWYEKRFGPIRPEWYVFAFGRPWPNDPNRPMVTRRLPGTNVRVKAGVTGRWHDNRHTLITDLAESGAGDETIRDIVGHVSPHMLKHYSHIRMAAKRGALESIVAKPPAPEPRESAVTSPERVVELTQSASLRRHPKRASAA